MQENQSQQSNKENSYELRRQQKLGEQKKLQRKRAMKRTLKVLISTVIIAAGIGGLIWYAATRPPIPEEEIISKRGIHWHSELTILAKGEKQEISANIGLGAVHQPIHTHDTSGVLHLEIQGLVRKEDTKLGRFFKIWGKDFMEFGSEVSMTVNGEENTDLANYEMKDGDKIELRYE